MKLGQDIHILPNLQPKEEAAKQAQAKGAKVEQHMHQLHAEKGKIEQIKETVDGKVYLVRISVPNKPKGALRNYSEEQAKARFKAL